MRHFEQVYLLSAAHPKPAVTFTYGTAGFRMKAELLDSVIFRVGLLAVLRSRCLKGKSIGAMITASHNPEPDNGVKLVDPMGEMLEQSWEGYASLLANASTDVELVEAVKEIVGKEQIDMSVKDRVVVGRDTRPSGPALVASLKDGIKALGGTFQDIGVVSTPILHFVTRCINDPSYGEPTEEGYYSKLCNAYKKVVKGKPVLSKIYIDAANGVGAPKMEEFGKRLGSSVVYEIVNGDIISLGKLNHNCGADHVKLYQTKPDGLDLIPGMRCCSLDGDADRIVYFFMDKDHKFKLLDGDKIATLVAGFIIELVRSADIQGLGVGVVQTAYANGSSTRFVTDSLKIPVSCVQTGVKHLHHEAEKYDVGVYFEANGHGTVIFSSKAQNLIRTNSTAAGTQLNAYMDVINQTVGDAISDMLMVEAILTSRGMSLEAWNTSYTDLPSRQEKVKVSNRSLFKTIKADQELVEPAGLQAKVNAEVKKHKFGRCFVRPSGTEDIVRVYAEADTQENTDKLAYTISGIVFDEFGGVGERPAKYFKA